MLRHAFEDFLRLGELAAFLERLTKRQLEVGVVGLMRQCPAQQRQRLAGPILPAQQQRKIDKGRDVVGIDGERQPEFALRLLGLVELRERRGQAASRLDELRIEIKGGGETVARLLVPVERRERLCAADHRLGIIRIDRQRPIVAGERFLVAVKGAQRRAEAEIRLRLVRVRGDRRLVGGGGVFGAPQGEERCADGGVRAGRRMSLARLLGELQRLLGPGALHFDRRKADQRIGEGGVLVGDGAIDPLRRRQIPGLVQRLRLGEGAAHG
jgi:hypothetical protein